MNRTETLVQGYVHGTQTARLAPADQFDADDGAPGTPAYRKVRVDSVTASLRPTVGVASVTGLVYKADGTVGARRATQVTIPLRDVPVPILRMIADRGLGAARRHLDDVEAFTQHVLALEARARMHAVTGDGA